MVWFTCCRMFRGEARLTDYWVVHPSFTLFIPVGWAASEVARSSPVSSIKSHQNMLDQFWNHMNFLFLSAHQIISNQFKSYELSLCIGKTHDHDTMTQSQAKTSGRCLHSFEASLCPWAESLLGGEKTNGSHAPLWLMCSVYLLWKSMKHGSHDDFPLI